jgi:WD40 repeat protein
MGKSMMVSEIRHVSVASSSDTVAAAYYKRTVQIWDLQSRKLVSQFETVLSFGGDRLSLSPDGTRCIAASWTKGRRGGIVCYDARSGGVVWHRQDIGHTQGVYYSSDGETVWCWIDKRPLHRIEAASGKTREVMRGVVEIRESNDAEQVLLWTRSHDLEIVRGGRRIAIPALGFALSDAAFGQDQVCVSEAGGPTRCFDSNTGVELWRTNWQGQHPTSLFFDRTGMQFYAVTDALLRYLPTVGTWERIYGLKDCSIEDFCSGLRLLITSNGDMISLESGALLDRLAFPQREVAGESQESSTNGEQ